jgi:type 1 glutamine amidotransferase
MADFAEHRLLEGFDVVRSTDLAALEAATLAGFDLLVPIWTFGDLTADQEGALVDSVAEGMGLVSWHGATSAFRSSRRYRFLLGGEFVDHPGGPSVTYDVTFRGGGELVAGLDDLTVTSEQYHLLVDPAVEVLATTRMEAPGMKWLRGVEMPVAWARAWGSGRVFYCSLGHTPDDVGHPSVVTLLRRAVRWACRTPAVRDDGPGVTT